MTHGFDVASISTQVRRYTSIYNFQVPPMVGGTTLFEKPIQTIVSWYHEALINTNWAQMDRYFLNGVSGKFPLRFRYNDFVIDAHFATCTYRYGRRVNMKRPKNRNQNGATARWQQDQHEKVAYIFEPARVQFQTARGQHSVRLFSAVQQPLGVECSFYTYCKVINM